MKEQEELESKDAELTKRLSQATFDELQHRIRADWAVLDKYEQEVRRANCSKYALDKQYTAKRQEKGLAEVEKRMEERLNLCLLNNMNNLPAEFSKMRMNLEKIRLGLSGQTCSFSFDSVVCA